MANENNEELERLYVLFCDEMKGNFSKMVNSFIDDNGYYPEELTPTISKNLGLLPLFKKNPKFYNRWAKEQNEELKEKKEEIEKINLFSQEVDDALSNSKRPIQRLGQGIHEGYFYYGTSLIHEGYPVSAIVVSNGKGDKRVYLGLYKLFWKCKGCGIIEIQVVQEPSKQKKPINCDCKKEKPDFKIIKAENSMKNIFGLNYRTEFNEDALDVIWQTESVKNYINGNYLKEKLETIYNDILKINEKYIDHLDNNSHKYIACWIIGTYCYTIFEHFGRLYNRAERGSGKTKQAKIYRQLCFNPMWISKGTESSIFRDAEATCGTFIVDNMDKLHEDLKKAIEHYIEVGWLKEACYRLTDKETGRTKKFSAYTPMAINNIYGLDENTIDKTFEIPMLKSVNDNIKRIKPTDKSENWESIRDRIKYWVLDNWLSVQETYEKINANFSGREFDVVEGTLCIAKLISEELYKELEKYVNDKIAEDIVELENNKFYMIFSNIYQQFQNETNTLIQEKNIFPSDIADTLFNAFNPDLERDNEEYKNKKRGFSKYIAKLIRSVPMFRKGGLSQGRTYITIKKKDLIQYMKLQKFIDDKGNLLTSTYSTNSTTSTTSTIINNNDKNFLQKVEQVEQVEQVEEEFEVDNKKELDKTPIKPGLWSNERLEEWRQNELKKKGFDWS